ncbi:MAG: sugar porter family MFS transporter [Candidatus Omnitrophica bacterium]|nr:sugar porter family MFS transporter [Candidatus Omnitrophota bacterium]
MEQKPGGKENLFVYVAAGVAALAGLLFGYDTGVISGAVLFLKDQFALTSASEEVVVSAVLVGAIAGAALSGQLSDMFGRKKIIIATAVIFVLGSLATALAPGVGFLVAGRVVIGIAIGIASFAAPLYISEVSPPNIRGALVSLNQLAITCGIVLSYLIDYLFAGRHEWRWMFAVGAVPAILLGIGISFLPASPRWLMSRSLVDRAREVLGKIRQKDDNIEEEISDIRRSLTEESGGWKELFQPWLRMPLVIGIGIMFFQQITGINTVIYYAPTIFGFAGFGSAQVAILATMGVGIVNVLMTVVAIKLVDRVGRRKLLFWGLAGMVISLGALGFAFNMASLSGALKWVAVGSLMLYIASFAVSLGPIAWLIIAEVFPLKIRGRAMSLSTMCNWAFNLVIAMTFLTLIEKLGKAGTFWLYSGLGIAGWLFCFFFVPETKGHKLEDIEEHWRAGKPPREL